jgi:hypothetical protein
VAWAAARLPSAPTRTTLLPMSPAVAPFSGSATHWPSTTSLYWCSPAGRAITTLQTPFASFTIGLALAFQPLNSPAQTTVPALGSV